MAANIRIQFDASPQTIETVERLRQQTGLATRKDVYENAWTLLEWAVGQQEQNRKVVSMDKDFKDRRDLAMPAIQLK